MWVRVSLLDRSSPESPIEPASAEVSAPAVPPTRTSAAWISLFAGTVLAIALIIFIAQNTRSVRISFLGFHTSTSLALSLIIAAVGATLLTLLLGTARITQLRRNVRRSRPESTSTTT